MRSMRALVVAAVAGLAAPAWGLVQITEDFTTDPTPRGWSGVNNTTPPQNYGYQTTDVTGTAVNPPGGTASGAGEIGGSLTRSSGPANFYGLDLGGSLNIDTDAFHVSGVIVVQRDGGSGTYLGYSNGAASYGSGGDAANFIGIQFDDGNFPIPITFTPGGGRDRNLSMTALDSGTAYPFSMDYDPAGNGGNGALSVSIGSQSVVFTGFNNGDFNPFTHFGMMPVSANGATAGMWLDDLNITVVTVIPEPASLGLLTLGGLSTLRRRRR